MFSVRYGPFSFALGAEDSGPSYRLNQQYTNVICDASIQKRKALAHSAILVGVERCRAIEVPDHRSLCGVGVTGSHAIYDLLMLRKRELLLAGPDQHFRVI